MPLQQQQLDVSLDRIASPTLPVDDRSPPLGLMLPHSREQGIHQFLLSQCIPDICTPDHPGRGAL
jgi:hypothetical protein